MALTYDFTEQTETHTYVKDGIQTARTVTTKQGKTSVTERRTDTQTGRTISHTIDGLAQSVGAIAPPPRVASDYDPPSYYDDTRQLDRSRTSNNPNFRSSSDYNGKYHERR